MDRNMFVSLREDLSSSVERIDSVRSVLRAAILAFGAQVQHHLQTEGKIVEVGGMHSGDFRWDEISVAANGGMDFALRLKFEYKPKNVAYGIAQFNLRIVPESREYLLTSTDTQEQCSVPMDESFKADFRPAFPLLEKPIQTSLKQFVDKY